MAFSLHSLFTHATPCVLCVLFHTWSHHGCTLDYICTLFHIMPSVFCNPVDYAAAYTHTHVIFCTHASSVERGVHGLVGWAFNGSLLGNHCGSPGSTVEWDDLDTRLLMSGIPPHPGPRIQDVKFAFDILVWEHQLFVDLPPLDHH